MVNNSSELSDADVITTWGLVVEGFARVSADIETHLAEIFRFPQSWFEVMLRLQRTPGHRLPMTQLAHDVSFSSGGFTKLADRLVEAGYLERSGCPNDRRVTWIELTELGSTTIAEAIHQHAAWLRSHVIGPLGSNQAQAVSDAFRTLRDLPR